MNHLKSDTNWTQFLIRQIRPESALERELVNLPEFAEGLLWGEPRFGHPEGKVVFHVREVLDNIDRVSGLTSADRLRLRTAALVHDTFKYAEDRSRPRNWSRHHAFLARQFVSRYTDDPALLELVETHDDAFYAWLGSRSRIAVQMGNHPVKTLEGLLKRVDGFLQLYYTFFKCDTLTGDKTLAPLRWFESEVSGISLVSW
jgi:hypothetical protein